MRPGKLERAIERARLERIRANPHVDGFKPVAAGFLEDFSELEMNGVRRGSNPFTTERLVRKPCKMYGVTK